MKFDQYEKHCEQNAKAVRRSLDVGGPKFLMYYVYLIKSTNYPHEIYTGYTKNLKDRLAQHNNGSSFHTSKYAPWELEVYVAFKDEQVAITFEKYLKSCSGRAFIHKRLQV